MVKPLAVLTRLEDSPLSVDRRLVAAYLRTYYTVQDTGFSVQIGPLDGELADWLQEYGISSFCFITAVNPGSVMLPEAENLSRHEKLRADLERLAAVGVHQALHVSADNSWPPERSLWVTNIPSEVAIQLGHKYGQKCHCDVAAAGPG